jgi:hypothetical protein
VLNAEWYFSDKYPVTVELGITYHTASTGVGSIINQNENIRINNPVKDAITMYFPTSMIGESMVTDLYDVCGRQILSSSFIINNSQITEDVNLSAGVYLLRLQTGQFCITKKLIKE